MHHQDDLIVVAGNPDAVQQIQQTVQNVRRMPPVAQETIHIEVADIEPHGILHTVIEVVPGGEWTVLSMFLVGVGATAWWRFGNRVEKVIARMIDRQLAKRKQGGTGDA